MTLGGALLVESLVAHGVRHVFCVAGESYLPVLNALLDYPEIKVITCRHESGASFMAESYANLTGRVGVVFVTRGPGACNASIGLHAARQSSAPVIMFSGLISSADAGKEAFQEFDIATMFAPLSKWSTVIDKIERIPEFVSRAFHTALSDRPGPVVIGLPEDILFGKTQLTSSASVIPVSQMKPSDQDLAALRGKLAQAERPVIIAGGGGWSDQACEDLASFSSASHIPVTAAFRRHDVFNHNHGNYIGELGTGPNPKLVSRVGQADLVIVLGERPDEMTMQSYTLFKEGQQFVHVYPSQDVFGKVFVPHLAIAADPGAVVAALAASHVDGRRWAVWRDEARKDYLEWSDIKADVASRWSGADMTDVFRQLRDLLPKDAIVTTDAGNFSGWCQRYLRYGRPGRLLAPVCGAMGYAVPSAVAASLEYPDKVVVGFCGDGGFMMTGQELATAAHHGAKPIIIVCNNNMYGTIRMHQEREYPGRVVATALTNPDFIKLGESYGFFAARVEKAQDFTAVWQKALSSGKGALIEITQDPKQISTRS